MRAGAASWTFAGSFMDWIRVGTNATATYGYVAPMTGQLLFRHSPAFHRRQPASHPSCGVAVPGVPASAKPNKDRLDPPLVTRPGVYLRRRSYGFTKSCAVDRCASIATVVISGSTTGIVGSQPLNLKDGSSSERFVTMAKLSPPVSF